MSLPAIVDTHGVAALEKTAEKAQSFDEESGSLTPDDKKYQDEQFSPANSETDLVRNRWFVPPDSYESKHRWDPKAEWTTQEENKLRRKLDWKVAAAACLCFSALQLDRGNISNALSDGMLKDLHMTTNNYNTGMTLFYLCFLGAELPSQMISKKVGSDVWIPLQIMAWSAVTIGQVGIHNKHTFYATRALLGLIEGGFIADTILYLSYYYTAVELTIRLSFFWVTLAFTNIIGALLASGILKLRGHAGLAGWRWLFAIEGTITFLIGAWAFLYLPPGPTQTKTRFRSKPWFTEREETIIVNKVLRDDPTKSTMHNREGLSLRDTLKSLADYDLWILYLLGLTTFLAPATVNAYFTLTLKSLGFNTFHTNLLVIPSYVLVMTNNLALAFTSKKVKERTLVASIGSWWQLIFLIVLVTIPDSTGKWTKWAILTLFIGYPYAHPILVSMNSMNAGTVRTRTVASSVYNMAVQSGSLIASNVYHTSDAPHYHKGNRVLIGIVCANLALFWIAKAYFVLKNRRREKIWSSWTVEQKDEYIRTTKDEGNKRLDFRFLH
ncbi:hypothetical protein P7C73_g2242, partial [Tremellales sp. Uapishka_1]